MTSLTYTHGDVTSYSGNNKGQLGLPSSNMQSYPITLLDFNLSAKIISCATNHTAIISCSFITKRRELSILWEITHTES